MLSAVTACKGGKERWMQGRNLYLLSLVFWLQVSGIAALRHLTG